MGGVTIHEQRRGDMRNRLAIFTAGLGRMAKKPA